MPLVGKIGKRHVSFPNHRLSRHETALHAKLAKLSLNFVIFGRKCVLSCVLSTTLKDTDIPPRLNSRTREVRLLVNCYYISDYELTTVSSSLHKVKFGS